MHFGVGSNYLLVFDRIEHPDTRELFETVYMMKILPESYLVQVPYLKHQFPHVHENGSGSK